MWDDDGLEPHERDGYADAMYDKAERDLDEMKLSGEWQRFQQWQTARFTDGLTGTALSLGEFRRQMLEDEAETHA